MRHALRKKLKCFYLYLRDTANAGNYNYSQKLLILKFSLNSFFLASRYIETSAVMEFRSIGGYSL